MSDCDHSPQRTLETWQEYLIFLSRCPFQPSFILPYPLRALVFQIITIKVYNVEMVLQHFQVLCLSRRPFFNVNWTNSQNEQVLRRPSLFACLHDGVNRSTQTPPSLRNGRRNFGWNKAE